MASYTITGFIVDDDNLNFKDTTYNNATSSTAGLMSSTDKATLDNVVQAMTIKNQSNTGGLQLNSTLMACKIIMFIFRRYGYWDSRIVPVSLITSGVLTNGAFIRFNNNEIKVTISSSGLVELTGTSASELVVDAYGLL